MSGQAVFDGTDLIGLDDEQMRGVRGAQIAVIFQDPLTSLHPLYKVGWQISEMIRSHDKSVSKAAAAERSVDLLDRVGIPNAAAAGQRLSASVFRRDAAAGDDRDGAVSVAEDDHRR